MPLLKTSRQEKHLTLEDFHGYVSSLSGDAAYCRLDSDRDTPGRTTMEQEKRIRREIANSNERRRMQSINAGFQSLRTLLPHHEGEKLSKAAILQQTAEFIYTLEQEKTRLLTQNCHLKRLMEQEGESVQGINKKRKAEEIELETGSDTTGTLIDVRNQLDRERRLRMMLEDQVRSLEAQLYPERIREITQKVQMQYQHRDTEHIVVQTGGGISEETLLRRGCTTNPDLTETVAAVANLQVVTANSLQPVSHTETVISSSLNSPPASPTHSRITSSLLEATIKSESKVEVERIPVIGDNENERNQSRLYLASTSRQNLETIVEAIRHLEGDSMFGDSNGGHGEDSSNLTNHDDDDEEEEEEETTDLDRHHLSSATSQNQQSSATNITQEMPLALTKANPEIQGKQQHLLKVKMNQYLHQMSPQQQRPGVIVVKQHT